MRLDEGVAARRVFEFLAEGRGKNVRDAGVQILKCGINGATNLARAKGADRLVNGHDTAHFRGIDFVTVKNFDLRVHHFPTRGTQLINFNLAVKDELLTGLEASFEVSTVKKFARE